MKLEGVHRFPDIYLTAEENPKKPQLCCATSHCLKWRPLPANDVDRIAQRVKKGERRHQGKDRVGRRTVYLNLKQEVNPIAMSMQANCLQLLNSFGFYLFLSHPQESKIFRAPVKVRQTFFCWNINSRMYLLIVFNFNTIAINREKKRQNIFNTYKRCH